jgi:hypothetical protein
VVTAEPPELCVEPLSELCDELEPLSSELEPVSSELDPLPDELDPLDPLVAAGVLVVVCFADDALSAGSWPVASCVKITPHTPRNTATAPPTIRRRMSRTRERRSARRRCPSSLASEGVMRISVGRERKRPIPAV